MPKIELASYVNFLEKYMEGVQNFVATDFSRLEYLKFLPIKCMFNVYPGPGGGSSLTDALLVSRIFIAWLPVSCFSLGKSLK